MLSGKIAFITGGARGIGGATARLFVERGARVVIADILEEQGEALAAELGNAARFVKLDIADELAWQHALAFAKRAFGPINVLFNNAAAFEAGSIEATSPESYEKLFRVNQLGMFFGIKCAIPYLKEAGGGVIVNTASTAALGAPPGLGIYTATKAAVIALSRVAAAELGVYGIRVNTVIPGSIDTAMVAAQAAKADPEQRRAFYKTLPVPRQGQPADIAEAVCFLASDNSGYCTATELVVDGGLSKLSITPPRTKS